MQYFDVGYYFTFYVLYGDNILMCHMFHIWIIYGEYADYHAYDKWLQSMYYILFSLYYMITTNDYSNHATNLHFAVYILSCHIQVVTCVTCTVLVT